MSEAGPCAFIGQVQVDMIDALMFITTKFRIGNYAWKGWQLKLCVKILKNPENKFQVKVWWSDEYACYELIKPTLDTVVFIWKLLFIIERNSDREKALKLIERDRDRKKNLLRVRWREKERHRDR